MDRIPSPSLYLATAVPPCLNEESEGTGIGLAIVELTVDRHGVRVWAESLPGEGSTFFITLPAG
jgi:signal transduction histidine kinase